MEIRVLGKEIRVLGVRSAAVSLAAIAVIMVTSCGGIKPTVFLHPEFNFGFVERIAVIPLENLTKEQGVASRATRFLITELLASEAFDVVEPGEVSSVMAGIPQVRGAGGLTKQQIIDIGTKLKVQGLVFGSVNGASAMRSGTSQDHYITLVLRMVETETGETVWSSSHTEGGRGFFASLFGGSHKPQSEVIRNCTRRALSTLIQ